MKEAREFDELIAMAKAAAEKAYAPYSDFAVGAAILTDSGKIFTGCNIENMSYGAAICAERTAAVKAVSEGETEFIAIAVYHPGNDMPYPCGICRQVLNEFSPRMRVLVTWGGQASEPVQTDETTLDALLPNSFGPESLGERV